MVRETHPTNPRDTYVKLHWTEVSDFVQTGRFSGRRPRLCETSNNHGARKRARARSRARARPLHETPLIKSFRLRSNLPFFGLAATLV